jgi:hypothetical protein
MSATLGQYSRFHATRVIREPDGSEKFSIWKQPKNINVGERLYIVKQSDLDRPDLISYSMYGNVDLWWIIMWYNGILDPFSLEVGDRLRVPDYQNLIPSRGDITVFQEIQGTQPTIAPPVVRPYATPPFQNPQEDVTTNTVISENPYEFNYGFLIPNLSSNSVHFTLEISLSEQFSSIVLSKSTLNSVEKWSYFNPFTNGGSGSHEAFPSAGVSASALNGNTVYYRLTNDDGLVIGVLYYVRHRAVVNGTALMWSSPPPFIMRNG